MLEEHRAITELEIRLADSRLRVGQGPACWPAEVTVIFDPMDARRLNVVYADDDAMVRLGVSRLLAAEGVAVRACASGAEAIALCQESSPDVVLLDIHMPGIDGVETARQMRSDPVTCALRLVALTGRGSWDLRKQAMDAGFDEFLSKPIPADVLLRALHG